MTYREDVDRSLAEWIAEQDRSRAPYLAEVLAVTQRTAQRPAWSFPARWLPVGLTMPPVAVPRGARFVALLALLLLALAVASAALVGSRRPVAPFGPASNGVVAYTTSAGDIATVDPSTNAVRIIVGGPERDRTPVFSRDGARLAFVRHDGAGNVVIAVDTAGGSAMPLTEVQAGAIRELAWSPDGSRLAFTAGGRIHMVTTDGSGEQVELPIGDAFIADTPVWRPPDGRELLFRGRTSAGYQLFLAPSDATGGPSALTDGQSQEFAWIQAAFTPDGRRIVTQRYAGVPGVNDGHYVVTTLTLESAARGVLDPTDAAPPGVTSVAPNLSPDGTQVVVIGDGRPPGTSGISVISLDDPASMQLVWPMSNTLGYYRAWTPDGSAILVWTLSGKEAWILDPSDGSRELRPWSGTTELNWQRTWP